MSQLQSAVANSTANGVQYDDSTHSTVTLGGKGSTTPVKLHNVADGTLAAGSTDAVNGEQLYQTNQNVANIAGNVTNINNTVNNITNGGGIKYFHTNSTLADSSATGTDAVAIGGNAKATANNSVALGSNSTTTANLSAPGYNPGSSTLSGTASAANGEVSVGSAGAERRITNVAAGAAPTDAVNVSQLMSEDAKINAAGADAASSLGGGSTYNKTTGAITNPTYNIGGNTYNNVGGALTNLDGRVTNVTNEVTNITNGGGIKYFHTNSTLVDSSATGTDAVAIGGNAQATAANSVALGSNSTTTANLSAAAYNPGSTILDGATAVGEVSVGSAGAERRITNVAAGSAGTDAVNVSQLQATVAASVANAVTYDDSTHTSITLGGEGSTTPVKLHNVADGVVAAGSTDAVNGEELYNAAQSTADALGGGSTVNSDGTITNPTYNIGGDTYNNVGGALTNLDDRVTNVSNEVNNIYNGGGVKYS
ncbi:YadA family autotransporter adhesin [Paraburkholderia sp. BCC1885]|uniref:YadA family autotransporter adhesin n=1 Tax=Paraburkholderia sp. BCC1885 TaxID=2562669 RepID=UPI0021B2606F|nr:hypothetical protein [Paraburkholderia sp. BCC1885]